MKKENKNFLYNCIYQIFSFIIPLITTPYISRVLGVENIGIYAYTYSITYYFILAAMLGINNYGTREIAKKIKNKQEMSKKFFSIYFLQLIMNAISIITFVIFTINIKYEYKNILCIQLIFLIANALDINWFFFGQEEFKITISRNIVIKLLSLILIFLFVKTKKDLWIYALIMSISTLISQLYLWLFVKKRTKKYKVKLIDIIENIKPCLILFIPVIAYSIYRVMDKTMIGFFSGEIELGFYESAEKIINIPLCFISALGTVIMPNITKATSEEFEKKFSNAFYLTYFLILPMIFTLIVISKEFSNIFFGQEYYKTPNIIIYLLPTIIFGGTTNLVRNSYLIPKSLDKIYVTSTIIGAIINLILNIIFIPKYGAYGACVGTISAEFSVMIYQYICTRKKIKYGKSIKSIIPIIVKTMIMTILIYSIKFIIEQENIRLITQVITAIIYYLIFNYKYIIYDFIGKKGE